MLSLHTVTHHLFEPQLRQMANQIKKWLVICMVSSPKKKFFIFFTGLMT